MDSSDPRIAFFDRIAPEWDSAPRDPAATVTRLDELAGELSLQAGDDLLEVGCGTGQITGWLAEKVAPGRVVAMDFSEAMLNAARAKWPEVEFACGDVCEAVPGQAAYDVVLCFHSLPHFRDMSAALANLSASLRPGGRLLVMHLNSRTGVNAFHDQIGGEVAGDHIPSDEQWARLLPGAGLEQVCQVDREGLYLLEAHKQG